MILNTLVIFQRRVTCSAQEFVHPKTLASADAKFLASSLINCRLIPVENAQVCETQTANGRNSCTKSGLHSTFKKQAGKVGKDGLFIFAFTGWGIKVGPNDWDWSLAGFDFEQGDSNTHITAATLSRWISELPIKPMHIIFILDCKSAGNIASALVHPSARNCEYPDNLYVISACGNDENSITFSTLGHSIFTYITSHIFHTIPQNDHRSIIPLKEICADIISCCAALSSLVVTCERPGQLKHETFTPKVMCVRKESIPTMDVAPHGYRVITDAT